jgi:uncharacterized membrane protein
MRLFALLAFTALLLVCSACYAESQAYYADVEITVGDNGLVSISGITNHPGLRVTEASEYTSKSGPYWLLNITIDDLFSDFVYTLRLPAGSVVNYLKSDSSIGIRQDGQGIIVEGQGRNKPFVLIVQYSIFPIEAEFPYLILLLPVVAVVIFYWHVRMRKSRSPGREKYRPELLTERQLRIVRLLEEKGSPVSQKVMERKLGIPKASLSRNIDSLVRKGVISKERKGMSNIIYFSEEKA